jgi:hypothetical protein
MGKKKSSGSSLLSAFKSLDMFSDEIKLTYKGESSFKTYLGATVSALYITMLLSIFLFGLTRILNKDIDSLSTERRVVKESDFPEGIDLSEYGYKFAIGFEDKLTNDIGKVIVTYNNYYLD